MILAFPAWRLGFFKATGGLMTEAIRRGHTVHLIPGDTDKPGERVTGPDLESRWPRAIVGTPLVADAALGPSPHLYRERLPRWRAGGERTRIYALDLAWENVTLPVGYRMTHCWASAYQGDLWIREHGTSEIAPVIWDHAVTGSPMIDALAVPDGPPNPRDAKHRPYVLLMALKFPGNSGWWRRYWYKHVGYRRLVHALQRFCRERGLDLVIKTRAKNRDPGWLASYADRMETDRYLWPYTSARLIRAAALVVHFQSGAALEAAFCSVPQISVHLPQPHLQGYPAHYEVFEASPGMQDWPGVVLGLPWQLAAEYIEGQPYFPHIEPAERADYVRRFLGFDDAQTAARILDIVEANG